MQTIEDGMIKERLICHLKKGDVQGVAENSSMLVARRQQRMIIDSSMELVQFMHPAYTTALLKLFKTCNTIDLIAKLITISFRAIKEADGRETPIDDKVSVTIKSLIDKYGERSDRNVDILKSLPLKIGKKWKGIASCCVRVIKEKIPQQDHEAGAQLLALLHGEVPLSKKEALDAIDEDTEERRIEEIKLGILWTYTRGPPCTQPSVERSEPEDKVIRYSGQYDSRIGQKQEGVICLNN